MNFKSLLLSSVLVSTALPAYADRVVDYEIGRPDTREDRSPLPASEISHYTLEEYLNGTLVNTYRVLSSPFTGKPLPDQGKITARVAVVDIYGLQSDFTPYVDARARPAAPGSLSGKVVITTTTTVEIAPGE